jgi:hypothetical protein
MIPVVVCKDHFSNIGQIDLQIVCVLKHGIRVRSRIQQHAMTIGFDQCRRSVVLPTSIVDSRVTLNA